MRGNNAIIDASSVCCGGDDAGERLVGDGTDVDHRKTVPGKLGMQCVECDTGLSDDVAFVGVDLVAMYREDWGSNTARSAYLQ